MRRVFTWCLFGCALAGLLCIPGAIARGCAAALDSFWGSVFPGLFPALVLCRCFLPRLEFPKTGRVLRLLCALTGCPAELLPAWCTARFCGNPAGAAMLALQLRGCRVSPKQATVYALMMSGVSPGYLVITVGTVLLGSAPLGWLLWAAQEGMLLLLCRMLSRGLPGPEAAGLQMDVPSFPQVLSGSLFTLGQVGGLMLLCSCAWEALASLPLMARVPGGWQILLQGLLEMSRGCTAASLLPQEQALIACCLFTGFSGLCIAWQSFAQWEELPVHRGWFLAGKALQALLACALTAALYPLLAPHILWEAGLFEASLPTVGVWEILPAPLTVLTLALWGKWRAGKG